MLSTLWKAYLWLYYTLDCHFYGKIIFVLIAKKPHPPLLKNLPPFFPIPNPERLDVRKDLESGCHFNSLRVEKRVANAGVISLSLILLHETTLSLWSSFQEKITDSKPSTVSSEHPSKNRNFTLLKKGKRTQKLVNAPKLVYCVALCYLLPFTWQVKVET